MSVVVLFCSSCTTAKVSIADKKYSPKQLREDFTIFRGALEELHPSLYWFTPKPAVDKEFDEGYARLTDSMTERQFRMVMIKIVAAMRCGHTSVGYSKKYSKYIDTAGLRLFPLSFKVWKDTLVVTANLNKRDSLLHRGTLVTSINGRSAPELIDTFLRYVTGDGYSVAGRYQSLSSYGSFGVLYKNLFGLTDSFHITFTGGDGQAGSTDVPVFKPMKIAGVVADSLKPEKYTPRQRRTLRTFATRHVQIDTTLKSAYMMLNTFSRGNRLRRFFRSSFKNINRLGIEHLVVDVRSNGGGEAGNAILLTQYLADHRFRIGDSLYAIKRSSRYRDYIKFQPIQWLVMTLITRRHNDGNFHFGYFERHTFKPLKKYHFDKNVYILTGGNSFSATTLFAQQLKGQRNVKIVGEETGGGSYGNTAWIIPELQLPHTRIKVGIPRFRFVMNRSLVEQGRGVMPDIFSAPSPAHIQMGIDLKLETVRNLIFEANAR